ncbi:oxidoreductase domain-containing protein [Stemphylium lycopersici]|nr:oxidoreductase domain-containing protein [Stemphylium lycopersici]
MASKLIAIVAGVGAGTGASVARKFSAKYPVVLLARSPENYEPLAKEINSNGGKAIGISTDVSDASSLQNAVEAIKKEFGQDVAAAAAIFNASGPFMRKPFLETPAETFQGSLAVSAMGGILFSQSFLPLLLNGLQQGSEHPPSLIFTGATASVKSNAQMSSFSTGKWALRALSQSLAREFGPQGVHVAHAVIDGAIDIPRTREWLKDMPVEAKLNADAYLQQIQCLSPAVGKLCGYYTTSSSSLDSSRRAPKLSTKSSENEIKTPDEPKQTSVMVKQPVVANINPASYRDSTKMKTDVAANKVEAAIQATRDRMARIMGRHPDRPSTADRPIGRGSSTLYGGYTKRR